MKTSRQKHEEGKEEADHGAVAAVMERSIDVDLIEERKKKL